MISRWPIRYKLRLGVALLMLTVAALAATSFIGVYAFRGLAKSLRLRAPELPLSSALAGEVSKLGVTHRLHRASVAESEQELDHSPITRMTLAALLSIDDVLEQEYRLQLGKVRSAFKVYRDRLESNQQSDEYERIGVQEAEQAAVAKFEATLDQIELISEDVNGLHHEELAEALGQLKSLSEELPQYLHDRMFNFADEVRGQYRVWIAVNIAMAGVACVLTLSLLRLFYVWVFRPLDVLIDGSRRVATGDFKHRIRLETHDEMAELATDMNNMTRRFQEIRDDLDRQVRERTMEVVRSEQLASVGFLAAGVAHEINNPLASIAMCAESLEGRLSHIIVGDDEKSDDDHDGEVSILRDYLRMMQDEAFRCKEITERLLDFSRLGDVEKQQVDMCELVQTVIEMVKHIGKYKEKTLTFQARQTVFANVNAQEMKQVVLNLLTNALDSLNAGGRVQVTLSNRGGQAELLVSDNGCGMSREVQQHLFEPFYTRRRDGQGTGLGMSITYRIVNDHGGSISVHSAGPGHGSTITVSLPLVPHDKEQNEIGKAA